MERLIFYYSNNFIGILNWIVDSRAMHTGRLSGVNTGAVVAHNHNVTLQLPDWSLGWLTRSLARHKHAYKLIHTLLRHLPLSGIVETLTLFPRELSQALTHFPPLIVSLINTCTHTHTPFSLSLASGSSYLFLWFFPSTPLLNCLIIAVATQLKQKKITFYYNL